MLKSKFLKTISFTISFIMLFFCFASANTEVGVETSDIVIEESSGSANSGASGSSGSASSGGSGSASGEDGSVSGGGSGGVAVPVLPETGTEEGGTFDDSSSILTNGMCGEFVSWSFEDGVLTISGTGDMYDYEGFLDDGSEDFPEYYALADSVTEIIIEEGVTSVGNYAFYFFDSVTQASIPSTVKIIKSYGFYHCMNMKVTLSEGLETLENNAFVWCKKIFPLTVPKSVTEFPRNALGSVIESSGTPKIIGYTNTAAEYYANERGFEFESLGVADYDVVYVENAKELIASIGTNKKIILKDGIYTIHKPITIKGFANIIIEAENPGYAEILSYDGYNAVINITESENIELNGLILGHRYIGYSWGCGSTAYSSGYVVYAQNSDNILIDYCDLYGCGTVGVYTYETPNLKITNSIIRDCSERVMYSGYANSGEFLIENCIIYGNGYGIDSGIADAYAYESAFYIADTLNVKNSLTFRNYNPNFASGDGLVTDTDCTTLHNGWQGDMGTDAYGICLNGITWQIKDNVLMLGYDLELSDDVVIESALGKVLPYSYSSLPWTKYDYSSVMLAEGVEYEDVIWCTCGDNAEWTYYDGKLTIAGSGELYDMEYYIPISDSSSRVVCSPWQKFNNKITEIEISDDVRGLQQRAFEGTAYYKALTGNEKYIGKHLISANDIEGNYVIKEGTMSIADRACEDENMTSLVIPEGVQTIGNYQAEYTYTFSGCSSLETITLPSTLTHIYPYAFAYCNNIKTINFNGTKEQWYAIEIDETNTSLKDANIYGLDFKIEPETYTYDVIDNEVKITSIRDNATEVVIPETINGYPVTSFDYSIFKYKDNLEKVEIKAPITSLYSGFYGCEKLETIILPDTLTQISYSDFQETALYNNSENWENGILYVGSYLIKAKEDAKGKTTVKDGTTLIGDFAFELCQYITNIAIPESVKIIGQNAFAMCTSLEELVIPDNTTVVKADKYTSLFGSLESLKSITLPKTYTEYNWDFSECYKLENILVRDTNEAFKSVDGVLYTKDLKALVFYPQGKTSSAYSVPEGAEILNESSVMSRHIQELILPTSITTIVDWAICECNMLSKITYKGTKAQWDAITKSEKFCVPSEFISIYGTDFEIVADSISYEINDTDDGYILSSIAPYVTELEIPATYNTLPVKAVADWAFESAVNLKKITVESKNEYLCDVDGVLFTKDMKTLIKYPAGKEGSEYTVPEGVTGFGIWPFEYSSLEKLTLPKSMTVIPNSAFEYMIDVKEFVLPETLKEIGNYAFYSCDGIKTINLPKGLEKIGNNAFAWCKGLEKISIPDSVTEMGTRVFYGCSALKTAEIGTGLSSIPDYTFYNCSALTRVTFGKNITSIGNYAFYGCQNLRYLYFVGGTGTDWGNVSMGSSNYPIQYYVNIKYVTEFPEGAEINRITIDGYVSESGTVSNPYIIVDATYCEDAKVLVIGYDKNNKIVDKQLAYLGGTSMEGEFSSFKVIAIESFETMKPLCKSKTQKPQI